MAESINALIQDKLNTHQVDVFRFEAGVRDRLQGILAQTETEVIDALKKVDPADPTTLTFRMRRLQRLEDDFLRPILKDGYADLDKSLTADLKGLAIAEDAATTQAINGAVGFTLTPPGLSEQALRSVAVDANVTGNTTAEWWRRMRDTTRQRSIDTLRQGIIQGDNLDRLVRRLRGTRANNFKDGTMEVSRRGARTLARTAVTSVQANARLAGLEKNAALYRGVYANVTFDSRTSPTCQAFGALPSAWTIPDHKRIPPTPHPWPGPPDWHPNCRSSLNPILKDLTALAKEVSPTKAKRLKAAPPAFKDRLDGQVPPVDSYETWLRGKPETFQRQVLGPTKWRLWQQGQLSLTQLIDQTGRPLTLAQLRAKIEAPVEVTLPPPPPPQTFAESIQGDIQTLRTRWAQEGIRVEEAGLRVVGSKIRKEVEKRSGEREKLRQRLNTLEERDEAWRRQLREIEQRPTFRTSDTDIDQFNAIVVKVNDNLKAMQSMRKQVNTLTRDGVLEVMREVRPMGQASTNFLNISGFRSPAVQKSIRDVEKFYPREWLEASAETSVLATQKVKRGFYRQMRSDPAVNKKIGTIASDGSLTTALHELGHHMEEIVRGLSQAERQFYERRTKGEKLKWLGKPYDKTEKTRFDEFLSGYMGKDYGGSFWELFTVGMEDVFPHERKPFGIRERDTDYYDFILGILGTL